MQKGRGVERVLSLESLLRAKIIVFLILQVLHVSQQYHRQGLHSVFQHALLFHTKKVLPGPSMNKTEAMNGEGGSRSPDHSGYYEYLIVISSVFFQEAVADLSLERSP